MYGRTTDEQRFSPLSQINEQKHWRGSASPGVKNWAPPVAWKATPIVANGVIYTTVEWSVALAMDARSGAILWTSIPR